jgi:hypothetical protein
VPGRVGGASVLDFYHPRVERIRMCVGQLVRAMHPHLPSVLIDN